MNKFSREYLRFSKKERAGIFLILIFIFLGISAPLLYKLIRPPDKATIIAITNELDSLNKLKIKDSGSLHSYKNRSYYKSDPPSKPAAERFYFDPNTLNDAGWGKLGINPRTIQTIKNYISKGGHFYKPDDLSKIYGLSEYQKKTLIPYAKIENPIPNKKKFIDNGYKSEPKILSTLNINTADSSDLVKLPGIGPVFSNRILKFRKNLGGFYSKDQLAEVYGFPDSTFQKIKSKINVSDSSIKKININTASIEELKKHPYIRYAIAKAIISYRAQHGDFKNLADLKNILIIPDPLKDKIIHYLSIN